MNKSYSKIRHIQESNLRLETRVINEEKDSFNDLKKEVMDVFRKVSKADFTKDEYKEVNPTVKQVISHLKDIIEKYQ